METVLRVAIIYFFLMLGLRVIGKREFGQLAPFDLVVLLMIPEIVQQALVREDFSITNALIGLCTLLSLVFLTSVVLYRFDKLHRVVSGGPSVVVSNGHLVADTMHGERITPDEIYDALHKAGLQEISQVKWGILQADGKIAIIPWEQPGPLRHRTKGGHETV